ncbi:MAG TPA: hypothetical protein VE623_02030 [Acidimicrobiales bacterium]|jgi:hypothetical protein|nr:hypothetical protein [Acidimicrobiales bacterium]
MCLLWGALLGVVEHAPEQLVRVEVEVIDEDGAVGADEHGLGPTSTASVAPVIDAITWP